MASEFEPSPQPESAAFFHRSEGEFSSFPQGDPKSSNESSPHITPTAEKPGNLSVITGRRRRATFNSLMSRGRRR